MPNEPHGQPEQQAVLFRNDCGEDALHGLTCRALTALEAVCTARDHVMKCRRRYPL